MPLAPWRPSLARALHRNRSCAYSRYLQMATVKPDGRPANRTVVFRGFVPETDTLIFVTDSRSQKIQHLALNPASELCWYFTKTREQFRLSGQITLVEGSMTDEKQRQIYLQTWESLSSNARQQFAWPHPGQPRKTSGFEQRSLDSHPPLGTFVVLMFTPGEVDHLELRGDPQNRYHYQLRTDSTWLKTPINP